jgi:hypothetical protein
VEVAAAAVVAAVEVVVGAGHRPEEEEDYSWRNCRLRHRMPSEKREGMRETVPLSTSCALKTSPNVIPQLL